MLHFFECSNRFIVPVSHNLLARFTSKHLVFAFGTAHPFDATFPFDDFTVSFGHTSILARAFRLGRRVVHSAFYSGLVTCSC